MTDWLQVQRGTAPLILTLPHTGTEIPPDVAPTLADPWRMTKDTDWWIERLYDFAPDLGVTVICSAVSRTVIDLNRDPAGASLYPGQATTELCPTTTFDGEPLYLDNQTPDAAEIARRTETWFWPYHRAIESEMARLRKTHPRIVLYDAHSIRSVIPRLFDGELPILNLGTNLGATCAPEIAERAMEIARESGFSHVRDGRFRGGWTVRHHGNPSAGVHALQMETAIRGYLHEPDIPTSDNWPSPYDPHFAEPLRAVLQSLIQTLIEFP